MILECMYRFDTYSTIGTGRYNTENGLIIGFPKELFKFEFDSYQRPQKDVKIDNYLDLDSYMMRIFSTTEALCVIPYYNIGTMIVYKDGCSFALKKDNSRPSNFYRAHTPGTIIFEGSLEAIGLAGSKVTQMDFIVTNRILKVLGGKYLPGESSPMLIDEYYKPVDEQSILANKGRVVKILANELDGFIRVSLNEIKPYKIENNKIIIKEEI